MENDFCLIVAGSKELNTNDLTKNIEMEKIVETCIDAVTRDLIPGTTLHIIEGAGKGADLYAKYYAGDNNIDLIEITAEWLNIDNVNPSNIKTNDRGEQYNSKAGYERNIKMMQTANKYAFKGLLYVWDGKEKDFSLYTRPAKKHNIPTIVYDYTNEKWYYGDDAYTLNKKPGSDWTLPTPKPN